MRLSWMIFPVLLVATAAPLRAEEDGRYQMDRTDTGYTVLDTQTGEISSCERRGDRLLCDLAADERSSLQDDIDRLQRRVEELEGRIAALEKQPALPGLPTEEEFDRTMTYMQKFLRGFMGIVEEMQDKSDGSTEQKT